MIAKRKISRGLKKTNFRRKQESRKKEKREEKGGSFEINEREAKSSEAGTTLSPSAL
jgi:hypothetical protein